MHKNRSLGLGLGVVLPLVAAAGCPGSAERFSAQGLAQRAPADFASRHIPHATLDDVRPVAAEVFRASFRLDPEQSTGNLLVSRPSEVTSAGRPERVREVLGRPSRQRQVAVLQLRQEGESVLLLCHVRIERLETLERTAFARERGDDRPTDTPIDRAGADAPQAREEWVAVHRDRAAEADLLDRILGRLPASRPAEP